MRGVWAELQNLALERAGEVDRVDHATRQARAAFRDMRERLDVARETYGTAREEGQGRVSAGLAALRAAAGKGGREASSEDIKDRLAQIVERDQGKDVPDQMLPPEEKRESVKDRLNSLLDRSQPVQIEKDQGDGDLDKDRENERDVGSDTDRGEGHSL